MSDAALSAIQTTLARMEAGQNQLVERLTTLEQGQRSLEEGQRTLVERLDRFEERLHAGDRTVLDLRVAVMDRMDRLQDALAEHRQQADRSATETRAALMERMDRLQDTLTGIRDDVGVNMHHSDRVRQAHDNTREELRSMGDSVAQLLIRLRKVEDAVRILRGDP